MFRINNTQYFHFLHEADAFRRSGSLCDAIISVKSQTFRAHRLVLACASRRLAQQLAQADKDSPAHCTLEHFLPRTFQQVLDFMYMQTLEVSEDDLHLLLRAAKLLEMEPLEDQCQMQLDNLPFRTSAEITAIIEDKEHSKEMDKKQEGSPVQEKKLRETSSPVEESRSGMKNLSTSDSPHNHNGPLSPKKKPRISHLSANSCNQDSGVARPESSSSSVFSPWTFPSNMWSSVSTLRRIAENYTNYLAHYPNPAAVVHPFPLSTPHMLPLLGSHLQSSVMGYPGFHPRFTQNIYTESTGVGSIIKQGLLKRKKPNERAFTVATKTSELRYHEVPKASPERDKGCQHCSKGLLCDPELQDSSCTTPGVTCVGCRFCGKGAVSQQESQTNQQDHRGEKPYQCQHCPKRFSLKHQLDTHHRVHTGEKPFECRLCGQRSRDYSAMIKHLRTHGGAAPYQCTVCLEFCSSLVAMQRHVKGHAVQDFPPDWSISSTYLYISHI